MKYNPDIVKLFLFEHAIKSPELEYKFHPERKWRFDFAWPWEKVALEVEGGIWIRGGHNRGAQMKKTWERDNIAAGEGWRILRCEPKDLCTFDMAVTIQTALSFGKMVLPIPARRK